MKFTKCRFHCSGVNVRVFAILIYFAHDACTCMYMYMYMHIASDYIANLRVPECRRIPWEPHSGPGYVPS